MLVFFGNYLLYMLSLNILSKLIPLFLFIFLSGLLKNFKRNK